MNPDNYFSSSAMQDAANSLKGRILAESRAEAVVSAEEAKELMKKSTTIPSSGAARRAAMDYLVDPPTPTTPGTPLEVIEAEVRKAVGYDATLRIGGEWITKVTQTISAILKEREEDDE